MSADATVQEIASREYLYAFVTDLEADTAPRGLNEDVIRMISAKKNEPSWMLDWRLRAYHHWLTGVAVDAIVDSVSVGTTFKKKLAEVGVIFCSFSEAVQSHPDPSSPTPTTSSPRSTLPSSPPEGHSPRGRGLDDRQRLLP